MRLKPSLFQLVVVLMTSSLIVSCSPSPKETQVNCNDPAAKQSKDCNSSSGSRSGSVYLGTGGSNGRSPSQVDGEGKSGSRSNPGSKAGRGGFGSFSRGSSGG